MFKRGETVAAGAIGSIALLPSKKEITPPAYTLAFKTRDLKLPVLQPISFCLIASEGARKKHSFIIFSV